METENKKGKVWLLLYQNIKIKHQNKTSTEFT